MTSSTLVFIKYINIYANLYLKWYRVTVDLKKNNQNKKI